MVARPVVASIGGSILAGTEPKPESLRRYAQMLDDKCPMPLGLVVGGGAPARRYIETARALGLDETGLDSLGITVTRANAWLMVAALAGSAYPHPAKDFEEAALALRSFPRVIMGGTHPGHTTDAVAAMLAERVRAERLVIVTNVDGVYTADPKKEPKAKLMEHVGAAELVQIAGTARGAGSTGVVDPLAAQLILRSRMPTRVCNGTDLDNVANALTGKSFKGTTVQPAKA